MCLCSPACAMCPPRLNGTTPPFHRPSWKRRDSEGLRLILYLLRTLSSPVCSASLFGISYPEFFDVDSLSPLPRTQPLPGDGLPQSPFPFLHSPLIVYCDGPLHFDRFSRHILLHPTTFSSEGRFFPGWIVRFPLSSDMLSSATAPLPSRPWLL